MELEEGLIAAVQAVARRLGVPEDEVYERALRGVLARDFAAAERPGATASTLTDEIAEYQAATGVTIGAEDVLSSPSMKFAQRATNGGLGRRRAPSSGRSDHY